MTKWEVGSGKSERVKLDSWEWEQVHRQKVLRKLDKIQGLQALVDSWEAHPDPDYDYLRQLKAKLRSAQQQYAAMKP
jgi:hypothetical protein